MTGRKDSISAAAIPGRYISEICADLCRLFTMKCNPLPNYLCVTLTPSNQLLHTVRLYNLFHDYREGKIYPDNILFHEEWDEQSSALLLACDGELQQLCGRLSSLDLVNVISLRIHYESNTVKELTSKIRSITAFKGILSPMVKVPGGWIPDWGSRYFTSDFSYGLAITRQFAEIAGLDTPNIDKILGWYAGMPKENHLDVDLKNLGLNSTPDIYAFYKQGKNYPLFADRYRGALSQEC
jgi:opine dehydrogenase